MRDIKKLNKTYSMIMNFVSCFLVIVSAFYDMFWNLAIWCMAIAIYYKIE